MNVLSLFDGLGGTHLALKKLGVEHNYFASEIDKHAVKVTSLKVPNITHLGDVTKWREWNLPKIDLLVGGSPCQGFSFAGKGLNFEDERSKLFFQFVEILRHCAVKNPNLVFLLENVKMKKEHEEVISNYIGIEPVFINSSLVSAQNRQRLYWFGQIRERFYFEEKYCLSCSYEEKIRRIQSESSCEGIGTILGKTQGRYGDLQDMSENIFQNQSQRNNENVFGEMSKSEQEITRSTPLSDEKESVSKELLQAESRSTKGIPTAISQNRSWKIGDEKSRCKTGKETCEINANSFTARTCSNYEKTHERTVNSDNGLGKEMCCVRCGERLDHRPHYSFIKGWNESTVEPTSSLSKMQFKQAQQNNGRIFDVVKVGIKGLPTLFGETIADIPQPEDKGILLKDILETEVDRKYYLSETAINRIIRKEYSQPQINPGKTGTLNTKNNSGQLSIDSGTTLISDRGTSGAIAYHKDKCPTLRSATGCSHDIKVITQSDTKREVKHINPIKTVTLSPKLYANNIRRLTPVECERLQTVPDNATKFGRETLTIISKELQICKIKSIQRKAFQTVRFQTVKDKRKQISVFALCTISDGLETEARNYLSDNYDQINNVNIVIEKSVEPELWECVINTTRCTETTTTRFTLKRNAKNRALTDIYGKQVESTHTELLWNIISEENSNHPKSSIISTALKPIIESLIYTYAHAANTSLCINNLTLYSKKELRCEISNLKADIITQISDSARYKMLGNGFTVEVIAHILSFLKIR